MRAPRTAMRASSPDIRASSTRFSSVNASKSRAVVSACRWKPAFISPRTAVAFSTALSTAASAASTAASRSLPLSSIQVSVLSAHTGSASELSWSEPVTLALRIFTEPQQGASYDQQLAVAQEAERLGFDAFFRSDHFLRMGGDPGGPEAGPGPTDSWVTLGALARETSRIRLATLVPSATFRLPGPLAIAAAQVR